MSDPFRAGRLAITERDRDYWKAECERLRELLDTERKVDAGLLAECERLRAAAHAEQRDRNIWAAASSREWRRQRDEIKRLRAAIEHVVNDSPGTPESVKGYLRAALGEADECPRRPGISEAELMGEQ